MKVAKQRNEDLARLAALVRQMKVAMLTTVEPDGSLRSRPLETLEIDAGGRLWFFTQAHAPKSLEVKQENQVSLSYADPRDEDYASISGTARVVKDKDKMRQLWSSGLERWFPRGLQEPDLALLEVRIDKAEYWDAPRKENVKIGTLAAQNQPQGT
ncbi:MAG TPA: pyridoxamine 5'-phosphate oxidase family protein [Burkholderiales bacterium]|nr:pyridoxamine 5'-phosphate oxidase family protein [Burkholderiales bacterium]